MLKLTWSNFFDDFVTLAKAAESRTVAIAVDQFFKLLGWAVSTGEKDLPFSTKFRALGVEVDLSSWKDGCVRFANTEQRVNELASKITDIQASGKLTSAEALSLRGRMQFANAQIWGRASKLCLNSVTAHAYSGDGPELSVDLAHYLGVFKNCLGNSKPREVGCSWDNSWFLFTDASFSPDTAKWPCGLGGVLVDAAGCQVAAFSCSLDLDELSLLGYPEKSTVIFEAELLALLVGLTLWKDELRNKPCVCYVDNNATRDVSIAGKARTQPGLALVSELLLLEDEIGLSAWYARVPSASNIADGPSRDDSTSLKVSPVPAGAALSIAKKLLEKVIRCG